MKMSVTVKLGNYGDIGIESSESEHSDLCIDEISDTLDGFEVEEIQEFNARILRSHLKPEGIASADNRR